MRNRAASLPGIHYRVVDMTEEKRQRLRGFEKARKAWLGAPVCLENPAQLEIGSIVVMAIPIAHDLAAYTFQHH